MPTLAVAVVESFLTMLDAQGLNPLSSAAQIVELESTAANTVKMLESDAQVACDYVVSVFLTQCKQCDKFHHHKCFEKITHPQTHLKHTHLHVISHSNTCMSKSHTTSSTPLRS